MLDVEAYMPKQCKQDYANIEIQSVCRDTNDVSDHSLFVCIVGQRFDGHDFALKAIENGAVALMVSRVLPDINVPQILVKDTVKALGGLANAWRKKFEGKLIAITGSAGKTTLKECLAQLLKSHNKEIACSILNYNNQIGLPLSILSTEGTEDYWIMEAGISQPHDMDELGAILEPDMVVILNAGVGHTEGLGIKGVAYHKAQLLKYIKDGSLYPQAIICADYADLVDEAQKLCQNICYFSTNDSSKLAKYSAKFVGFAEKDKQNKGMYFVKHNDEGYDVLTPFSGSYGAENVAALTAIMHSLGLYEIKQAMSNLMLPKQRFNIHRIAHWCIIDDSYNANVLSMQRMLEACVQQAANGPCYAVLGAMGELGELANAEHEKLGCYLAQLPISHIFWKGPYADEVEKGLALEKYIGKFITVQDENDFNEKWTQSQLVAGTVLIKGSRSNALEHLVNIILAQLKCEK